MLIKQKYKENTRRNIAYNENTLYVCIRKTSLSSQTDTKRAVREASLIPIVLCLNATKIGSPFHLSYKCANVLRHNYRFRGCYRDKRHLKSSIRVLT